MEEEQRPRKILVVDDEPDLQPLVLQRMRRGIRRGRYQFLFAGNGVEALEILRAVGDIDMVVSDINMPQMDGLTLLEQIPSVDPNIRAIIVSAYGDMANIRTAMNRGAFDFITKPIDFTDLQVTIDRTLEHLAEWRSVLRARDQLVSVQNELSIATQIQQSVLPTQLPQGANFHLHASMEAARSVGGDFYDTIPLADGRVGLAIADVSDKGVPAALFMMASYTLLRAAAGIPDAGRTMQEVNDVLTETNVAGMFVTMFYAVFDPGAGSLTYANGGHNPPVLLHEDGTTEQLPLTGGVALGVMSGLDYNVKSIDLAPGDTVFLYTDGIPEAINGDDEEYGMERLCTTLTAARDRNAHDLTDCVLTDLQAFVGDTPQFDDITCLTLRFTGAVP
ncbi:MAG: SpoIIE family protein phosphatase [Caldilineaceae bacterium]|nr:SpoIIE family protein phosphatase [Caldilineaceae bacterium]